MTTFADWYASKIAPQVEAQVQNLPVEHREPIRTASRLAMAECWNAALDAMKDELMKGTNVVIFTRASRSDL